MSEEYEQLPVEPNKPYRIHLSQAKEFLDTCLIWEHDCNVVSQITPAAWGSVIHHMEYTPNPTSVVEGAPQPPAALEFMFVPVVSSDPERHAMYIRHVNSPDGWQVSDAPGRESDGSMSSFQILVAALRLLVQSMIQQGFATTPLTELSPKETEDMVGRLIKEVQG